MYNNNRYTKPNSRLATVLLGALAAFAPACTSDDDEAPLTAETVTVLPDVKPGDMVVMNDLEVEAPPIGERVTATIDFTDGRASTLTIETLDDGSVAQVVVQDAEADAEPEDTTLAAAAAPGACQDRANSLLGFRWTTGVYSWKYNGAVDEGNLSDGTVAGKLQEAASNIVLSRNSCGMPDRVGARYSFGGLTNLRPDVTARGGCAARDGHNVVGLGALPAGVGGVTCAWSIGSRAIEADMKLNSGLRLYATEPAGCSNAFSIEAIATHEFGHVFGLGHVGEARHKNLTMSTIINGPCQNSESSLGRGDVLGLRRLY